MQLLRDECVAALATSPLTKLAIMRGAGASLLACCGGDGGGGGGGGDVEQGAPHAGRPGHWWAVEHVGGERRLEVRWERVVPPSGAGARLLAVHRATQQPRARALWPPGKLVMLRQRQDGARAGSGAWRAQRVVRPDALQQIRLTATMLVHHFPDVLLRAIRDSIAAEEAAERVLGGERNK